MRDGSLLLRLHMYVSSSLNVSRLFQRNAETLIARNSLVSRFSTLGTGARDTHRSGIVRRTAGSCLRLSSGHWEGERRRSMAYNPRAARILMHRYTRTAIYSVRDSAYRAPTTNRACCHNTMNRRLGELRESRIQNNLLVYVATLSSRVVLSETSRDEETRCGRGGRRALLGTGGSAPVYQHYS